MEPEFDRDAGGEGHGPTRGCTGGCLALLAGLAVGFAGGVLAVYLVLTSPAALQRVEGFGPVRQIRDALNPRGPGAAPSPAGNTPATAARTPLLTGPQTCVRAGVAAVWSIQGTAVDRAPVLVCRITNGSAQILDGLILEVAAGSGERTFAEHVEAVTPSGPSFRGPLSPGKTREIAFPLTRFPEGWVLAELRVSLLEPVFRPNPPAARGRNQTNHEPHEQIRTR